ncbi:MAG: class I tRNA ligase family protein, partial [Nitrososphaerales archaeon]
DILARLHLKKGRKTFFVLNITDIDDKIFDRAKKENLPYMEIADRFYKSFVEDLDALNIETVSTFARVSNYVEESAALVKGLLDSGIAYKLGANVYFDTSKADHFGKLSHQGPHELRMKQIDAGPGKKNTVDFLLWRSVEDATEGVWNTAVGSGRPGWHIQDSAIAFDEMQGPYDLHGGATELIFPHHEAELAQDETISGKIPFVKIWMHTGLFLKGQEKMSKSLGNVVTIKEAMKTFSADEIRFHFLKHHYRDSLEYSPASLNSSKAEFAVVKKAAVATPRSELKNNPQRELGSAQLEKSRQEFVARMDDDLDTRGAISLLLSLSESIVNENDPIKKAEAGQVFWDIAETLGFKLF